MNFTHLDDRLTYYNAPVQFWNHLRRRTEEAQMRRALERDALATPEAHQADVQRLRAYFLEQIGDLPESQSHTEALCCGEISQAEFTIQKLILTPRPGVRATAHLYRPKAKAAGKSPAILFLCGHSTAGKSVDRYQAIAQRLVANGLFVLILDPTGQGERLNYYDPKDNAIRVRPGTGDHEYVGPQCQLLGRSLIRYMVHDAICAMDYLAAHPEVDATRIGITGSSGGGLQVSLMLLLEPRLAAAAPATFVSSRLTIFDSGFGQDAEQIWPGFSRAGYDHVDLLMAFAPKPLIVLGAKFDFFPIEGTRQTVAEARRFWELYGRADELQLAEDRTVHRYTDELGEAAACFFAKVFQMPPRETPAILRPLPEMELRVTKSGQVLGDFSDALTIFDENRADSPTGAPQRERGLAFLKEAVYRDRGEPVDLNLRITQELPCADIRAETGFWWSSQGLLNSAMVFRPISPPTQALGVTIALWEDGTRDNPRHDALIRREIATGRAVMVLNVSGMGPLEPTPFNSEINSKIYHGSHYRIADDLLFLGDSYAALRTYDVLRCLEVIPEWGGLNEGDVRLYLDGPYGIYGALAAALEPRLRSFHWVHPLFSYRELLQSRYYNDRDIKSLILPGLLKFADWCDLLPLKSAGDHHIEA